MNVFTEYERATLKALIRQRGSQHIFTQLEMQDFSNPPTRAFFAVCMEFLKTHDTIEPSVILEHYPTQEGELEQIMQTPNNKDPESLIDILKEEAHRRALQNAFEAGSKECHSIARPRDIHAHALQSLEDISLAYSPCTDFIHDGILDDSDLLNDIDLYEQGDLNIIKSGYEPLDNLCGGFKPGDQIIIG
ncbi:hypothetical protein NHP20013_09400 [Helicobacter bizzozeronii]|nr:hypothetical protein NHP20013_09400 [Helicobacter bizzozeronii]